MQTIKWVDIESHVLGELKENSVYNLLVRKNDQLVDIRCRVISFNSTTVLIFKLKDE